MFECELVYVFGGKFVLSGHEYEVPLPSGWYWMQVVEKKAQNWVFVRP